MNPTITEKQQRFLGLRAKGKTYDEIAADLGVARRTLFNWNKELQEDLSWEEAAELESLHQELLGTREARARRLAKRLAAIEEELDKRSLEELSTAKLFSLADSVRRQLVKETTPSKLGRANFPASPDQLPALPAPPLSAETPLINTQVQLGDSAKPVQAPSGPLCPPRHSVEEQPSTKPSAPDCMQSANTVQPEQNWHSELSATFDAALEPKTAGSPPSAPCNDAESGRANVPVSPDQIPPSPAPPIQETSNPPGQLSAPQCKEGATAVQSPASCPRATKPKCQPISPDRLIGPNINFREALRAAKAAQFS